MKYADEMGSGVMIYIPSFIKVQAFKGWGKGDSQTHRHTDSMEIA
jgi:hypothetical protein